MPEFGIIILSLFFAGATMLALILAYCSITDGNSTHSTR